MVVDYAAYFCNVLLSCRSACAVWTDSVARWTVSALLLTRSSVVLRAALRVLMVVVVVVVSPAAAVMMRG
jgi:hypothetical protein